MRSQSLQGHTVGAIECRCDGIDTDRGVVVLVRTSFDTTDKCTGCFEVPIASRWFAIVDGVVKRTIMNRRLVNWKRGPIPANVLPVGSWRD